MAENLISRKAAIDAIGKVSDELYENIKKGATFPQRQWFDGMAQAQSILENLPSAQPDLSEYSDKLWKKAYERGKAEALDEIVRCKDCEYGKQDEYRRWYCRGLGYQIGDEDGSGFCSDAERKKYV